MRQYNAAFFGLYENIFLVLKRHLGEKRTLELFREIIERGLRKSYDACGFQKGSPHDFVRVVGQRDRSVGLRVKFPKITPTAIVYRFYTDPFPGLKGHIDPEKLTDTYMAFKVNHLLGSTWGHRMTKHLWRDDFYTEFVIFKKSPQLTP